MKRIALALLAVSLASCTSPYGSYGYGVDGYGVKQGFGTLGGAALGGLAGSQFGRGSGKLAVTGLGVLIGGLLGSETGKSLDRADAAYAQQATAAAASAPYGQTVQWSNPQTGNWGTVTPLRQGHTDTGTY